MFHAIMTAKRDSKSKRKVRTYSEQIRAAEDAWIEITACVIVGLAVLLAFA